MLLKNSPLSFSKSLGFLSAGFLGGHLLILATTPILTKLYSPSDFGGFALYSAWLSNLLVLMTGRYELAIMLPKSPQKAKTIMALSLVINIFMGLLFSVIFGGLSILAPFLKMPNYMGSWVLWLPVSLFLTGASQIVMQWNSRCHLDQKNALAPFLRAIMMVAIQILGGSMGWGTFGLLMGHVAGQATLLIVYVIAAIPKSFLSFWNLSSIEMKKVAQEYAQFPTITMPQTFIGALQDTVSFMLIGILASSSMVGLFGLTVSVLRLPAMLIGGIIAQVAYRHMIELYRDQKNLAAFYKKLGLILCLLSLLPTLLLMMFGPDLFAFIFGEVWRPAGLIAAIFAPYMLLYFLTTSLGMLPHVLGKQRMIFAFTSLNTVLYIGGFLVGWVLWHDIIRVFYLVSFLQTMAFSVYLVRLYQMASQATSLEKVSVL